MHISLKPLKIADVEKMLTELFNTEIKNVADLSADLYRKSGGNPFSTAAGYISKKKDFCILMPMGRAGDGRWKRFKNCSREMMLSTLS